MKIDYINKLYESISKLIHWWKQIMLSSFLFVLSPRKKVSEKKREETVNKDGRMWFRLIIHKYMNSLSHEA